MTLDYLISKKNTFNGLLFDTNLLLLLLVGIFNQKKIESFKRLDKYTIEDYFRLVSLTNIFSNKILFTPNILTEICNLSDNFNKENGYNFFRFIEDFIKNIIEYSEVSVDLIQTNQFGFYKFGLADTTVINLAKKKTLIITDDLNLYHYLSSNNYGALNYNHIIGLEFK